MQQQIGCDACAAAERNPLSGQARDGCPQCRVRRVARMPKWQREEIYAETPAEELTAFVVAVRVEGGKRAAAIAAAEAASRAKCVL